MLQQLRAQRANREGGFTLIELLIAIVVVGILSAVVIVGVGSLTNKGSSSACKASQDAAKAASVVHFANTGSYPALFTDMTGAVKELDVDPAWVNAAGTQISPTGGGWTLTIAGAGGSTAPTFSGCP